MATINAKIWRDTRAARIAAENAHKDKPMPMPSDDNEEVVNEEEEDEEPIAEETPIAPVPLAPPAKRKPGRPKGVAAPPVTQPSGWSSREAELIWPEMINRVKGLGKSPYDIDIMVRRMDPTPEITLGHINGGAVMGSGNQSPGDALVSMIDRNFHNASAHGPASYDVHFVWKHNYQRFGRGKLNRPSPDDLIALRRAGLAAAPPPYIPEGYGQNYGQAPQSPWQGQVAWPQPQQQPQPQQAWGLGAPPSNDPVVGQLQAQVGYLSGQLTGMAQAMTGILDHLKAMGAPAPAGVAAPPQGPPGPLPHPAWLQPPPSLGATQQGQQGPPSINSRIGGLRDMVQAVRELKALSREVDDIFAGDGDETLGAPAVVETPQPGDGLPFEAIEIPGATLGGKPVHYARNKETGDIDWTGIAMSNPQLAEKAFEVLGKVMTTVAKAAGVKEGGEIAEAGLGSNQPAQLGQGATQGGGMNPGGPGGTNGAAPTPTPSSTSQEWPSV